jgi:poly(ribitol-phosphate) beta-N-acetylglucosaminyltransferase
VEAPAVSVIVPVYNPGANVDDCIASILGQSLDPGEYEAIFVDDGSTDATPARLDALAAEHEHVRVEHIPSSGWPGRPRNVGLGLARGEFAYFVDNDDWLGPEALERLVATARREAADVVVGKVVGHGKPVPHELFERSRCDVGLDWPPLVRLLTPHKLFRRALLDEHAIRFPEGRHRLEDHVFTMRAYFAARRVCVLADYPCYHWMRREEENASYERFDPRDYYGRVREVLDLVEAHTEPGPGRDRLMLHWYRGKMLGRVGGRHFFGRPPDYRGELYETIRELALDRYPDDVAAPLPVALRVRSRLLRDGRPDALEALAEVDAGVRARTTLRAVRREGPGALAFDVEARLAGPEGPLRFERRGERVLWRPPEALAGLAGEAELDATAELAAARVDLVVRSASDGTEYVLPARLGAELVPEDGALTVVVAGEARLDVASAAAGSPLPPGDWHVVSSVTIAGFEAVAALRRRGEAGPDRLTVRVAPDGGVAEVRRPLPRRIARRVPWVASAIRRVRGGSPAGAR